MRRSPRSERPAVVPAAPAASPDSKRRRFLLALGAGGAGAAAARVGAVTPIATEPAGGDNDMDARYSETTHVRDYYRTAKL